MVKKHVFLRGPFIFYAFLRYLIPPAPGEQRRREREGNAARAKAETGGVAVGQLVDRLRGRGGAARRDARRPPVLLPPLRRQAPKKTAARGKRHWH